MSATALCAVFWDETPARGYKSIHSYPKAAGFVVLSA